MNRLKTVVLIIATVLLGATSDAWSFASKELSEFAHDTHEKLTTRAIANSATSDYPDLGKFQGVIISGASTEGIGHAGGHTSPDGAIVWWLGNDTIWREHLLSQYKAMNFNQAYKELGFMVHLKQDIQVPAHRTVTFHGLKFDYSLSPDDDPDGADKQSPPLADYIQPVIGHIDNFENFVSDEYNAGGIVDDFNNPVSPFNSYPDPNNLNCSWRFWLDHYQSNAPQSVVFWGDYGKGNSTNCADLDFGKRSDWFGNALLGNQVQIAQTQLFAARTNTETLLRDLSKVLPPLLKSFQTSTQFPGANSPATLTYQAMDNRSANLTFSAKIMNLDGTDTGKKAFDGKAMPALVAGTVLPFEGNQSLSWNGAPTDGSTLADGQYKLCGVLTDGDGNSYPGPSDQATDTCVNFTAKPDSTPPALIATSAGIEGDSRELFFGEGTLKATRGVDVWVTAMDFVPDSEVDFGSGLASLHIYKGPDEFGGPSTLIGENLDRFPQGYIYKSSDTGLDKLAELPEGLITFLLRDQALNYTRYTVIVDRTQPDIQAFDVQELNIGGRLTASDVVVVRAIDPSPGAGVYRFSIVGPKSFPDTVFSGADAVPAGETAEVTYESLIPGRYTVTAHDPAGNTKLVEFTVVSPLSAVSVKSPLVALEKSPPYTQGGWNGASKGRIGSHGHFGGADDYAGSVGRDPDAEGAGARQEDDRADARAARADGEAAFGAGSLEAVQANAEAGHS